jgi:ketosteroid isomerase-like protein
VRRSYEAYNAGDFDAVLETMTGDIVFEPGDAQARAELGGPYEGAAAVRAWFEGIAAQASDVRFEIQRLESPGPDTVIASIYIHGVLRDPGVAGTLPVVQVITMRGGLIARNRYFRQGDGTD